MKTKTIILTILAIIGVLSFSTLAFAAHGFAAHGFVATPAVALAIDTPSLIAEVVADPVVTETTATPWYLSADVIAAVIALVTSALAIWQNKEKKTAQKVSETLVVAIEQASKIPAVAEKERELKAKIQEVTTKAGVEPIVNKLVNLLT